MSLNQSSRSRIREISLAWLRRFSNLTEKLTCIFRCQRVILVSSARAATPGETGARRPIETSGSSNHYRSERTDCFKYSSTLVNNWFRPVRKPAAAFVVFRKNCCREGPGFLPALAGTSDPISRLLDVALLAVRRLSPEVE